MDAYRGSQKTARALAAGLLREGQAYSAGDLRVEGGGDAGGCGEACCTGVSVKIFATCAIRSIGSLGRDMCEFLGDAAVE